MRSMSGKGNANKKNSNDHDKKRDEKEGWVEDG